MKRIFLRSLKFLGFSCLAFMLAVGSWMLLTFQKQTDALPKLYLHNIRSIQFNEKETAYLSYVSNDEAIDHIYLQQIQAKARGGATADYPKHNYSIELSSKHSLGGLPLEDDWILNASYLDKSFLRHSLSFEIFRSMHPNNRAPQCTAVEVYRHLSYHGLYILMERMDARRLNLDKHDSGARIFKDPPLFEHPSIEVNSNPYRLDDIYHQKYPDRDSINKNAEIDSLRHFIAFAPDSLFENQIQHLFDLQNIIDWHLLLLLTHNGDGLVKNFYLYKEHGCSPYKIAPWDYDHSFGRDGDNVKHAPGIMDCSRNILLGRLEKAHNLDYQQRLKKRYFELRNAGTISVVSILGKIDKHQSEMRKSVTKNNIYWPTDASDFKDNNTFVEELNYMRHWILKHTELLDSYFNKL